MNLSETVTLTATERTGTELSGRVGRLTMRRRRHATSRVSTAILASSLASRSSLFSCPHQGENICEWTHDPDHDFDFERRSGYNNKTITIVTGPHADHTTGIPFQGHYMVINTNTEVHTKSARLISPLFRITAQIVCFRFYYHMYGYSLGTLRVYAKPESVELQDVLVQDTEMEARSKYVVFEMKGLSWKIAFSPRPRLSINF